MFVRSLLRKLRRGELLMLSLGALLAGVAGGCASIGNPSGGPRDEMPPRFVRANPAPGAVNVSRTTDKISIDFDEIVNVKDAFTNVVVSPPSSSTPRVSALGKRVTVAFTDSLLPNTTYTIDFGSSIEDNNEANPLRNFSYSFSTGETIDTLRIAGFVADALTLEPLQGKLVGVHSNLADSAAYTSKFLRVAKTDDRGRFSIEGLAPGTYRVYALDDTNSDYIYSSPEETFAFSTEVLSPYAESAETVDSIFNLKTGKLDTLQTRRRTIYYPNDVLLRSFLTSRRQQFISKYERRDSTQLYLEFGAPMRSLPQLEIIGAPDLKDWATLEHSATNDTLTYWLRRPSLVASDTLRVRVTYEKLDSASQYISVSDTLRFTTDRAALRKAAADLAKAKDEIAKKRKKMGENADSIAAAEAAKTPLISVNFPGSTELEIRNPIRIMTDVPTARVDTALFRLEVKRDTLWTPLPAIRSERYVAPTDSAGNPLPEALKERHPIMRTDSLNPRLLIIEYPWEFGTTYRLQADTLALHSMYGLSSASISKEYSTRAEKEYSTLILRLTDWPAAAPAFVELLNSQDGVIARAPVANGVATFPYLLAGKYYARVINDHNGDGRWQTGDIHISLLPEESYYYPKAINIKQNWNKDETWRVFDTPIDAMKPEAILKNKPKVTAKTTTKKTGKQSALEEEEDEE